MVIEFPSPSLLLDACCLTVRDHYTAREVGQWSNEEFVIGPVTLQDETRTLFRKVDLWSNEEFLVGLVTLQDETRTLFRKVGQWSSDPSR